ncbi:MAG TPA: intein-containing RctB family protein [Nitrospiraceae bacterium]|jgi:tRNA-splicing ligase RtcB|nr:intein-containing RctB family protein [Nitrospiraceae bacterium]
MKLNTEMAVNRIADEIWEIPPSEKPGMLVPARIYATERILETMDRGVFDQVTNVACLPGIRRYALCMPDGHWGYGFPIGGVAAFDTGEGVISPGGVGYDVNCLDGDSQILHELGYWRPIKSLDAEWPGFRVTCVNPSHTVQSAEVGAFLIKTPTSSVLRVTTESGRQIYATADHPFLTRRGMVALGRLVPGDQVSVYPFDGVPYQAPRRDLLLTERELAAIYRGTENGLAQALKALRQRNLLPLTMDNPKLPRLIRLMGFVQGAGHLQLGNGGRAKIGLYGEPEDLAAIRRDIEAIGFRTSRVYARSRTHEIMTHSGRKSFRRTETAIHVRSSALALLLVALGVSGGNKAGQNFGVPFWLDRAPLWMKRLYLAAFFGAELSSPRAVTGHPDNFSGPILSVNKRSSVAPSGKAFMTHMQTWLQEFGVASTLLADREKCANTVRLRLQISSEPDNLIRLWTRIGYDYNRRKQYLANVAAHYLKLKTGVLQERATGIEKAVTLRKTTGASVKAITDAIGSPYINERFVARSFWEGRCLSVGIGTAFADFHEFLSDRTEGLGTTGQVWDTIIHIESVDHRGPVYDLTVLDDHHNFIANGFVVSNCGMRLIRTDLTLADVQPRLETLMTELFRKVPAGVGSTGFVRVTRREFEDVMRKGARWCVEKGYGWHEDLARIEEGGCIAGADPSKVSDHAVERGINQLGTLGSGNHYLEVQVVSDDRIFDPQVAAALGITGHDQIVVMVHCGSRGFGHQVASDYLKVFEKAMRRYGITVKDQQLACAPFRSPEGQDYFAAMNCAANSAFANRQVITHQIRQAFAAVFGKSAEELGMHVVYDVAHNIAKVERYPEGELVVHRKGSTRAFGPGRPELPEIYRAIGQPVICGGSMETGSYLLVGTERAMQETFGSTMHGSGRTMSRAQAKKSVRGEQLQREMKQRGILVKAVSMSGLAEEAGFAYKNISDVVETVDRAGITKKVAELRPIGNIKG